MNVVIKVDEETKNKMIEYYKDKTRDKTPPYAIFQAQEEDTIITLYSSGKCMFQGTSAFVDANMWKAIKENDEADSDQNDYMNVSAVGSDEVGTGDYFGPIVVTASYVNKNNISFLEDLGVKDSKKLTDEKILKIAPTLIDKIPHETFILTNKEYNLWQNKGYNMNKIKCILHNRVILNLLKKDNYIIDHVVIDQFTPPRNYFSHLKDINENVYRKITFTVRAEDKCLSVGCSSIISRYIFLKEMDKLSNEVGISLPKGASTEVDKVGKYILEKYNLEKLDNISKKNFKNREKITEKA